MLEDTYCYNHCRNCILTNCPSQECRVVKCPLNCGCQMHACKLEDHVNNICPLAEVPCISASFGCPRKMQRQFLGHHLFNCPASIVHCTAEWNRMPRYTPCLGHFICLIDFLEKSVHFFYHPLVNAATTVVHLWLGYPTLTCSQITPVYSAITQKSLILLLLPETRRFWKQVLEFLTKPKAH
ncbi:unnamed protein product [Taenia asiatica]|uniref:TRAF-type domain-containing protein n=1 Tax=Taenia asiatica TaxID=60517 RepID=A0A0R3WF50_TAEAS|nr:unnamed protein product [Taenia asiatica]